MVRHQLEGDERIEEMNFPDFERFQADLLEAVLRMGNTKGREYANSEDRFANFRRLSAQLGISDAAVGWVYCTKHLDSIAQFLRTSETHSTESIYGRFVDAITYLTLIAGMVYENEAKCSAAQVSAKQREDLNSSCGAPQEVFDEPNLSQFMQGKKTDLQYKGLNRDLPKEDPLASPKTKPTTGLGR